jgi:hypothetical protein
VSLLLATLVLATSIPSGELVAWRLSGGRVQADAGAPGGPLSVGSLQKPFLVRAWAAAHPSQDAPRHVCRGGDACWYRPGHGEMGLVQALAQSCNSYFRELAAAIPAPALVASLRRAGFRVDEPISPAEAIGLDPGGRVSIEPRVLLGSYATLLREPWSPGEPLRRELMAGLRAAAFEGTASALQGRNVWAKTGTSSAVDGLPLATSGWIVSVDDAGRATLGLLRRGTGREAAQALAALGDAAVPVTPGNADARITVQLFALFELRAVSARNLSAGPVNGSHGFTGPGGSRSLAAGDRLDDGLWSLSVPARGLTRVVRGSIACSGRRDGTLRLVATLTPREYVGGVIAAELPEGSRGLRTALAAAALRFLAVGPRHTGSHVCDSTHCAYFVGRGPRVAWPSAATAVERTAAVPSVDDGLWREIRAEAARPGPSQWTSHCGGAPLSARYVWGSGERSVTRCTLHAGASARPWSRFLGDADLARAFGGAVLGLRVVERDGVWNLDVEQAGRTQALLYDAAHRSLASALGWGALPSPAASVRRVPGGFRAEGVGLGHRVGLCLGAEHESANMAAAWLPPRSP